MAGMYNFRLANLKFRNQTDTKLQLATACNFFAEDCRIYGRSGSQLCSVHHALKLLFFLYGSEHTAGAPQWQKSHPFEKRAISRCQFVKNFKRMEKVIFFMVQNIQQGRLNIKNLVWDKFRI